MRPGQLRATHRPSSAVGRMSFLAPAVCSIAPRGGRGSCTRCGRWSRSSPAHWPTRRPTVTSPDPLSAKGTRVVAGPSAAIHMPWWARDRCVWRGGRRLRVGCRAPVKYRRSGRVSRTVRSSRAIAVSRGVWSLEAFAGVACSSPSASATVSCGALSTEDPSWGGRGICRARRVQRCTGSAVRWRRTPSHGDQSASDQLANRTYVRTSRARKPILAP